jgi:hypothetical protein
LAEKYAIQKMLLVTQPMMFDKYQSLFVDRKVLAWPQTKLKPQKNLKEKGAKPLEQLEF